MRKICQISELNGTGSSLKLKRLLLLIQKLSRDRKSKEEELNLKYQALLQKFHDNPCETTRLETEKVKSDLEALYDKKVEGIIIRSRARWHEHGEKNSKYFLNLEKRNNIKKHIRKLFVSGAISTDPFEILNTEIKGGFTRNSTANKTPM